MVKKLKIEIVRTEIRTLSFKTNLQKVSVSTWKENAEEGKMSTRIEG